MRVPSLAEAKAREAAMNKVMKTYEVLIPTFFLLAIVTSSCAQTKQGTEAVASHSPQIKWQYDTGG